MRKKVRNPHTIAIDLTPILPGGENGGAKIFVLELIRGLAISAPDIQFLLLTQDASHGELAYLDSSNVRRIVMTRTLESPDTLPYAKQLYRDIVNRLPKFIKQSVVRLVHSVIALLQNACPKRILSQLEVDLLFCPFTTPNFHEKQIPTVCTFYDIQFASYPQFFEPEDLAYRKSHFWAACLKADILIAISDYSRESAIAYGKLAPEKIKTVALRLAQRMTQTTSSSTEILRRIGATPQQYLIYPANFWHHKNHEVLLKAFQIACEGDLPQTIKLILTGAPGHQKEFIQTMAAELFSENRVLFPGYVSTQDLTTLLKNATGLIFPSLYEGFGLPVIEAMAVGIPVACSNVTALPEVAGTAAIFFDPCKPYDISQAMINLVLDESLRQQLIKDGYSRALLFSDTDRMISEYLHIFEAAIKKTEAAIQTKSILSMLTTMNRI